MMAANYYGKDVLRRRLSIRFIADPGKPWYMGHIMDYNEADNSHLIKYDDGEQRWHNLAEDEAAEQLRWLPKGFKLPSTPGAKRDSPSDAATTPPPKRVRKTFEVTEAVAAAKKAQAERRAAAEAAARSNELAAQRAKEAAEKPADKEPAPKNDAQQAKAALLASIMAAKEEERRANAEERKVEVNAKVAEKAAALQAKAEAVEREKAAKAAAKRAAGPPYARPRGAPPRGKVWDANTGQWRWISAEAEADAHVRAAAALAAQAEREASAQARALTVAAQARALPSTAATEAAMFTAKLWEEEAAAAAAAARPRSSSAVGSSRPRGGYREKVCENAQSDECIPLPDEEGGGYGRVRTCAGCKRGWCEGCIRAYCEYKEGGPCAHCGIYICAPCHHDAKVQLALANCEPVDGIADEEVLCQKCSPWEPVAVPQWMLSVADEL